MALGRWGGAMRGSDRIRRSLHLAIVAAALIQIGSAADRSFILETDNLQQPYTAAYLGNGAISLTTTPLATTAARTFLAGVYDHTAGDVPRIASAPAWNEVDVYNGVHWLNTQARSGTAFEQYHQELDMYDGILRTAYRWNDRGKPIRFQIDQFVSRENPQIAAVRIVLTPEFSGKLAMRLPLRNWPAPRRYELERITKLDIQAQEDSWKIWYPGWLRVGQVNLSPDTQPILSLSATAPRTDVSVGEAVALAWTGDIAQQLRKSSDSAEVDVDIQAKANQRYILTKFAAIVIGSSDTAVREAAVQQAEAARRIGWNGLLSASADAWHELWKADIVVAGNADLQRAIHSMLFYLLESTREDLLVSVGPMGLSTAGYYGHIFWDADTFMFPALLLLHPELAKPMVAFRSRTRPAAEENARKNGFRGAMYPWEADADGHESTPRFAFQNASSENHVNGDVALASWQYWLATRDRNWLERNCWPVLRGTADFWASRVTFDPHRGQYVIGNVVAVNESQIGVSNDAYTNAVAQKNLQLAADVAGLLHVPANPRWKEIAGKMYVPESDSALLWYPLDRAYSPEQTHQAIQAMLSRLEQHRSGAMMGTEFYPILAAQLGDSSAIARLLTPLYVPYLRPPFQVIAETPRNQNISFITGAGAFLQQFVFGYTGLRLTEKGLERRYEPVLPPGVTRLTLQNISIEGKRQSLVFEGRAR